MREALYSPNLRSSYIHPSAKAAMGMVAESARRMGLSPEQYTEREKMLRAQEEKMRKIAMDPNKSKSMSENEKMQALNASKWRRFRETGVGHIPGEEKDPRFD